ncbi:hypothetical protein GCM10025860_22370 [Methanobacterium ferruginis]|nr:hypothetical protein GCM10025860_22370 [Methanobacterium ferruginis]
MMYGKDNIELNAVMPCIKLSLFYSGQIVWISSNCEDSYFKMKISITILCNYEIVIHIYYFS